MESAYIFMGRSNLNEIRYFRQKTCFYTDNREMFVFVRQYFKFVTNTIKRRERDVLYC